MFSFISFKGLFPCLFTKPKKSSALFAYLSASPYLLISTVPKRSSWKINIQNIYYNRFVNNDIKIRCTLLLRLESLFYLILGKNIPSKMETLIKKRQKYFARLQALGENV